MIAAPPLPPAPRYGEASLCELLPAAVTALGGGDGALLPWPERVRGVVVLVVDGLGRRRLDGRPDLAPFLTSAPGTTLDAPFPTTTATSLTSLATGVPPGEHGVVGFSMRPPDHHRLLVTLTWSWDRHHPVTDARGEVVPEVLQRQPTVFERLGTTGISPVTVLHPDFIGSGLTRAALRGGHEVPAAGLEETLRTAAVYATTGDRTMVYAHHGAVDTAGHEHGPGSDAWCEAVRTVDTALQRLVVDLPADVVVVVTADHGMVATPEPLLVDLQDHPELMQGVQLLAGEPRARQLHTAPGAATALAGAWREQVGDEAHVLLRDEAIATGWFGPVVTERVRRSIGDVVVSAAVDGRAWVHGRLDPFGGRLPGQHGALTPDEVEVPALLLTRSG